MVCYMNFVCCRTSIFEMVIINLWPFDNYANAVILKVTIYLTILAHSAQKAKFGIFTKKYHIQK